MSKKPSKPFEELTFADDFMFGVVMREPGLCKPLVEMILGIRIERIEYQESQKIIDLTADSKSVRLDVYVEDEKHSVYDIEMQTSVRRNLPKRSRYYQGMIDLNLIDKGADYEELNKSFVIFICTFDMFGEGRYIYTFENRCAQNPRLTLGDGAVKVFVSTKGRSGTVDAKLERLLKYIDAGITSDEYTETLDRCVRKVRGNDKWRRDYMTLYMREREIFKEAREEGYAEGFDLGREAGMKQGLEEGVEQGIKRGIEQGLEQGVEQGIKQGIEQGIEQGLEQGVEQGLKQGLKQGAENGRKQGEERFAKLIGHMNADGRGNDIVKVCEDPDYRKALYEEYGI